MVQAKNTRDSKRLEKGAWPMPIWWLATQRMMMARVRPARLAQVMAEAAQPKTLDLKAQAQIKHRSAQKGEGDRHEDLVAQGFHGLTPPLLLSRPVHGQAG